MRLASCGPAEVHPVSCVYWRLFIINTLEEGFIQQPKRMSVITPRHRQRDMTDV
ncbi:unnamed protein product [Hymenolepis diminuta]|uniref:Uncharacterized protein n=1 Tax=Hymenolepis diminuta TaxID=6216 RepID=A0A564Z549_HYMDI|nr:unnamed protein product [Hymenolepis diminuta]